MKINIANPATGAQKKIEIEDENKLRIFMERRMAEEVPADSLGDEYKGYVFKITGGNDKDGFPMRQGVLVNHRVRLLLRRGMPCYRPKRKGERKRKGVRGCIVGSDIAALSVIIVKRGEQDLSGLTDVEIPRRLGPKRVDKIKKMFNLTKDDDVRDYIVRRKVKSEGGKVRIKKPKIQRLITSTIRHRRRSLKKRLENRRKRSYENRKQYFEKLAGVQKYVQTKKKQVGQKKPTGQQKKQGGAQQDQKTKKPQQDKGPQKGAQKKQPSQKKTGGKGSKKKQPTKQGGQGDQKQKKQPQAKKQPKKQGQKQ